MENKQSKQKMPVGMILVLILIGYSAVSLLLTLTKLSPLIQFGPFLLDGASAVIVNIIIVAILATIFFGISKRARWARKLAIGWYTFSMLLLLINVISFMRNTTLYNNYYQANLSPEMLKLMTPEVIQGSLFFGLIFGWILGLAVIIYTVRKKNFFVK